MRLSQLKTFLFSQLYPSQQSDWQEVGPLQRFDEKKNFEMKTFPPIRLEVDLNGPFRVEC